MSSWQKFCPDFKIVRWDESNFDLSRNRYCKGAYNNKKWAFVSDYARLDIINRYGGVYLDTDVELLKDLTPFISEYGFLARQTDGKIATGLGFAAEAGNPLVQAMLSAYDDISFIQADGSFDITACPDRNTDAFNKTINASRLFDSSSEEAISEEQFKMRIFPSEYMCPMDYREMKLSCTDNTISIHWFSASWQDRFSRSLIVRKMKYAAKKYLGEEKYDEITHKICDFFK